MCPACVATAGLIAASATSSGGIAALIIRNFLGKTTQQTKGTENETGRATNRSSVGS